MAMELKVIHIFWRRNKYRRCWDTIQPAAFLFDDFQQLLLEAIFNGSKYINTFDVNRLVYYGASLKYAARKALDYDKFMAFYCLCFPANLYNKVKRYLSLDVAYFWDVLFARYKNETIYDYLFDSANHDVINGEKHVSVYFKEEYEVMRRKLQGSQISFTETNLLNIHNKSIGKEKYNFIYLFI